MIKTIIVDDEVWVCKLICNIVDWESYGYEVTRQVYSGTEALEAIAAEKPDLVFTDIRMPGIDGLSLIREAERISPGTKFVIISGYSDFEYAKTAIDLNVLGYLLKPVEPEDLSALLVRLKDSVFGNTAEESSSLHEELKKSKRQFREQFMYNFLMVNPQPSYFSLEQFNRESGFSYRDGCFQVFQMMLDEKSGTAPTASPVIFQGIMDHWYRLLKPCCFDVCVVRANLSAVCAANFSPESEDLIRVTAEEIFHQCRNYIPDISRYSVTLGAGSIVRSFTELPASFHSAQDAVRARMILGTDRIISLGGQTPSPEIHELFPPSYKNLILRYLNHTCEYSAREATAYIFEKFDKNKLTDNPGILFRFALEFINSLYAALAGCGISLAGMQPQEAAKQKIESLNSVGQLKQYLAELLELGRKMCDSQKNKTVSTIEILRNYIEEHFSEDISLSDLAAQVYLNPKYVSELFKKETGVNFSDYLSAVRIGKAKDYLVDPRCRVSEIASRVGYSDIKYFSKLFKKIVGVTPSEFRKLHC
ncbi:response regulator [Christensenella intestinihominis]|uniref:response regulator n=1 Tax=Christensenella intestinihominis TaxID=1851429 RepID=UPI000833B563|nr:response regulator [Christensenella intestinihominis]